MQRQWRHVVKCASGLSPWSWANASRESSFSLWASSSYGPQCSPAPWAMKTMALAKRMKQRKEIWRTWAQCQRVNITDVPLRYLRRIKCNSNGDAALRMDSGKTQSRCVCQNDGSGIIFAQNIQFHGPSPESTHFKQPEGSEAGSLPSVMNFAGKHVWCSSRQIAPKHAAF